MNALTSKVLSETLPSDETAEREVLGFVLSTKDPFVKIFDAGLTPEDFYIPVNAKLFDAMRASLDKGGRVNGFSVIRLMGKDADFSASGGDALLTVLRGLNQGERRAKLAAERVKDVAKRRRLVSSLTETLFTALDPMSDLQGAIASTHAALADTVGSTAARKLVHQSEVVQEMLSKVDLTIQREGKPLGLSTGSPALDRVSAGLCPGGYYILAGRPGAGKTAMGINIATHVAKQGKGVLFFSLEMPRVELVERQTSMELSIDALKFRGVGRFTEAEQHRMWEHVDALSALPIIHYDLSRILAHEIRTLTHVAREQHDIGLVVVDYIGLVKPDRRTGKRHEDVGAISATIRETAKDLMIPFLALAQMNRNVEGRTNEPQLSDLRESGDLEQDAAAVMFLYEDTKEESPDPSLKRIILKLAKNRHGPECKIPFMFERPFLRFREVKQEWEGPRQHDRGEHWMERQ